MPTQPPHQVSSQEFQKPTPGTTTPTGRNAIMRNKPNPGTVHTPNMQNEPNLPPQHPKRCKTNPISTYRASRHPLFLRNEPNSRRGGHLWKTKKCETNPIHTVFPTFASLLSPLSRATARATQFPTTNIHSTIYNIQSPLPSQYCGETVQFRVMGPLQPI